MCQGAGNGTADRQLLGFRMAELSLHQEMGASCPAPPIPHYGQSWHQGGSREFEARHLLQGKRGITDIAVNIPALSVMWHVVP